MYCVGCEPQQFLDCRCHQFGIGDHGGSRWSGWLAEKADAVGDQFGRRFVAAGNQQQGHADDVRIREGAPSNSIVTSRLRMSSVGADPPLRRIGGSKPHQLGLRRRLSTGLIDAIFRAG